MMALLTAAPAEASGAGLMLAGLALLLMLAEALYLRISGGPGHDGAETAASLLVALGHKAIGVLTAGLVAVPVLFVADHRLLDIRIDGPWMVAVLFVAVDLAYYIHHRAMHKVRWLWATHAVHHSARRINLTAAVRLGWGGPLTGGIVFYLPLIALGFSPFAVFGMLGLGLAYQFALHLAHPPHLGPLEWVLNTPRHHLVHHASNRACLDRNFGGVLIVFDRLFGTFAEAPRDEALVFGLAGGAPGVNPLAVAMVGWVPLLRAVRDARGSRARLSALFGPPS
jgi:sterol desaturase/sphingolipid hydroxylase (fatty acid hydroxylase superfamily)